MRTGVVLGAGGYTGQAFHLGVLSALAERTGFDARRAAVLVGTSAGSIVAAGLAGGLAAPDLAAELLGEPLTAEGRQLRAAALLQARAGPPATPVPEPARSRGPLAPYALLAAARRPWAVRPAALTSSYLPPGRIATEPIARAVRHLHGGSWPAVPLRIVAVRARDARRVVFGTPDAPQVDVGTAVAASCAIPSYFAPVRVDGDAYVDGGVHSPSNADVVARDHLDLALVLSPMSLTRAAAWPPADVALRLAVRRYLLQEVRRLRRAGVQVVVVEPTPGDLGVMGLNPMRGVRVEEVLRSAERSMTARLAAEPSLAAQLGAAG